AASQAVKRTGAWGYCGSRDALETGSAVSMRGKSTGKRRLDAAARSMWVRLKRYPVHMRLGFRHSYAGLPADFYTRVEPAKAKAPRLLAWNAPLAEELGLDPA